MYIIVSCSEQSCYVRDAADLVSTAVTMDYILDFATVLCDSGPTEWAVLDFVP